MILERISSLSLGEMEPALRRAARRRRASISMVESLGSATVFSLSLPESYSELLSVDIRFAAFLPLRITAYEERNGVVLLTASPVAFGQALNRPEAQPLAASLESLLNALLDEVRRPMVLTARTGGHAESALGATEDQMNMRGTVGQRIDRRGTKVEEMAGTGEQDSPGG